MGKLHEIQIFVSASFKNWNTIIFICLGIVYGCFPETADLSIARENAGPA